MRFLSLFFTMVFLTACNEPTSTMGEMNDTTKNMAQTTADMKRNMEAMVELMEETKKGMDTTNEGIVTTNKGMETTNQGVKDTYEITSTLYGLSYGTFNLVKQGDTSQIRHNAILGLEASEDFNNKTFHATKFHYAFEYQVFTPDSRNLGGKTDWELLEKLQMEAIIEISKTLSKYMPKRKKTKLTALSQKSEMQNLYALVATLHKKNPYQQILLKPLIEKDETVKEKSPLDLIQAAFENEKALNAGEMELSEINKVTEEVLKERDLFIKALVLRARFIPLIAIARASDMDDKPFVQWKKLRALRKKWRPLFLKNKSGAEERIGKYYEAKSSSIVEIQYLAKILNESKKTLEFLASRGIRVGLERKVVKILSNMDLTLGEEDISSLGPARVKMVQELSVALSQLLSLSEANK